MTSDVMLLRSSYGTIFVIKRRGVPSAALGRSAPFSVIVALSSMLLELFVIVDGVMEVLTMNVGTSITGRCQVLIVLVP